MVDTGLVILTDAVRAGLTVIVTELDVAVSGEAQAKPDVMLTVTRSPFESEDDVKAGELVPALTPFTCH